MKRLALILALSVIMIGMVAGCADKGDDNQNYDDLEAFAIRDIQNDPLAFEGIIKINGIVSAFSENNPAVYFSVMDKAELLTCKNLYCGAFALPTKFAMNDPLPELTLADEVDMVGSFVEDTKFDYIFVVTDIEVKRNIMKLLTMSNPGGTQ